MNKKKKVIIVIIMLTLFAYILLQVFEENNIDENVLENECSTDSDCVPASCCHPEECVLKQESPECAGTLCTMMCSGPLDCNAGHCGCINKKCEVIPND